MVLLLSPLLNVSAQWEINASMGLDFRFVPSLRDYINLSFAPQNSKLASFTSAINFSGEINYVQSSSLQYGVEYSILIDSYNTSVGIGGLYEISYLQHRPTFVGYYVLSGEGYKFKFGGGAGPRFVLLTEKIFAEEDYTTIGLGFLLKAEGNTLLSNNLFVLIGADLRYDIPGKPENKRNQQKIINSSNNETVNINSLSLGIKLGITYSF